MTERSEAQRQAERAYRAGKRSILIRITEEEWAKGERLFGKGQIPAEAKRLLLAAINRSTKRAR